MYFDRILELNVETGKIISEKLIATSQEGYDSATAAGFEVILAETGDTSSSTLINFKSYSENISNATATEDTVATKGNFSTNQITASDGASLFRQEEDGTVHIGENSIVLSDEAVSASGNDEVYSSSGTLQLGNNASHKTVIKGSLEVPKPKTGNEAANKSYVDGVGAMVMAAAQLNMMYNPDSVLDLGFGLGSMDNENAIAVGLGGVLPDSNMRYSLSATYSDYTAQVSYGAGLSFSLK